MRSGTTRPDRASRDHGQIQADELHITTHGGVVWVACVIAVASRLSHPLRTRPGFGRGNPGGHLFRRGRLQFLHAPSYLEPETTNHPAMAAGITTEAWSVEHLYTYHPAMEPWEPPTHRGRKSAEELACLARWRPDRLSPSEQQKAVLHG